MFNMTLKEDVRQTTYQGDLVYYDALVFSTPEEVVAALKAHEPESAEDNIHGILFIISATQEEQAAALIEALAA